MNDGIVPVDRHERQAEDGCCYSDKGSVYNTFAHDFSKYSRDHARTVCINCGNRPRHHNQRYQQIGDSHVDEHEACQ